MAYPAPTTISQIFANQDSTVYIPGGTPSSTQVSQPNGFPLLQEEEVADGGLPVNRHEMNGVFNLYSQHILWKEVGGQYTFDPVLVAAGGGYNLGAVLAYYNSDGTFNTFLYSTKNNNSDNFITTPSFIGTSWIDISLQLNQRNIVANPAINNTNPNAEALVGDNVSFYASGSQDAGEWVIRAMKIGTNPTKNMIISGYVDYSIPGDGTYNITFDLSTFLWLQPSSTDPICYSPASSQDTHVPAACSFDPATQILTVTLYAAGTAAISNLITYFSVAI